MVSMQPVSKIEGPLIQYSSRLQKLLTFREARQELDASSWPDYLALGFTESDVSELLQMVMDSNLSDDPSLPASYQWAPVHACRVLGQLKAQSAIEPLLTLFDEEENEWLLEEIPNVYCQIGPVALSALSRLLSSVEKGWSRIYAIEALKRIAQHYPDSRSECIQIALNALALYRDNGKDINGFLAGCLLDLEATESAALIQEAYEASFVDENICGPWEEVGIELGVIEISPEERQSRDEQKAKAEKRFEYMLQSMFQDDVIQERVVANRLAQAKKEKKKRKAAKSARRQNRR